MGKPDANCTKKLFVAIAMLLTGCSRNLSGVYSIPGYSTDAMSYSFNKDSTFYFNAWSDILGKDEICGKWKISKDTILLFQNPGTANIESRPVATLSESNSDPSKIKIIVQDTDNEPIIGANLVFNNTPEVYVTNKDGVFETNYFKIDKLEIQYIGIGKHSFNPQASSNSFVIKFDFEAARLRFKRIELPEKLLWVGSNIYDLKRDAVISDYSFHKVSRKVKRRN